MKHSLLRRPLLIPPSAFEEVLLVRAFAPDDPIRNVLLNALETMNSGCKNPVRVIVADVQTKEEFADAFNNFRGPLAIFDGHGSQNRSDPEGTISVGTLSFNPFELYAKIRVPPIMFLSACETHTLEGYESSVAGAFLLMGCDSVIGTLVPIDALQAALLMARFAFRLSEFLPTLSMAIPWSQVVAGMFRMSYVTDVLYAMKSKFSLDGENFLKIYSSVQCLANLDINSFREGWIERLFQALAEQLSVSLVHIWDAWRDTCYFTETLRYVHLGQPEHIFVTPAAGAGSTYVAA